MIDPGSKLLIFIKDFTGRGADCFYWFVHDRLEETNPAEIVAYPGPVVCHDFWMIRDLLYDKTGDLPAVVLDIDELRISIGGNPDDRRNREKIDISAHLGPYGASEEVCAAYKRMFNRGIPFDAEIATKAAGAIAKLYLALCAQAAANGEMERFFSVEMPVYRLLQKAMSAGIMIEAADLSAKRREAEHDYFYCLKNYSAKHDMPLETPSRASIERKLHASGFEFEGVSTRYVLEFVPHPDDFGGDTLALEEFDAAKRVLSSLTLAGGCTRPIVDVFGSRTSRILLRNPPLQSISKKYRSIIGAREGAELGYVDFDQFEVGIMAALSGDQQLAALPGRHERAGYFQPRNVRSAGRRRIFALPLQHVGPVHPGGGHADQHLVIARDLHWPRLRHQRIGPTGHGNGDRHHLARYAVAIGHRRFPPKPAHAAPHQNRPAECAPLLTEWPAGSTLPFMDKDDDLPHRADDPLARLLMQDLDPLSVAELDARIAALKAEIARTEAKMEYAVNHKAIAEALFKR